VAALRPATKKFCLKPTMMTWQVGGLRQTRLWKTMERPHLPTPEFLTKSGQSLCQPRLRRATVAASRFRA